MRFSAVPSVAPRSAASRLAAATLLSGVLLLAGCGSPESEAGAASTAAQLAVVATTPEVADFVRNVGGDRVQVTQIIKPNVDPHEYEPTPAGLKAIGEAKLVVKNGVGLEEWLDRTIESAGFSGTIVDSSQGVPLREGGHTHEESSHEESSEEAASPTTPPPSPSSPTASWSPTTTPSATTWPATTWTSSAR
ncbi:metal ABC transporter substrate-binding protein [Actinoplanes sp. GCM10030250]|uniref:metal ABC transporter substrate-binding protein n=1 Tax=Actinoplanes sp. GCM10030250 TaxID=3273376 RepID=UPI003618EE79